METLMRTFACIILFGCTAASLEAKDSSGTLTTEEINIDMRIELLSEKFQKNGYKLLCREEAYVQCFEITENQCADDIRSISEGCIKYASKKIEEIATLKERSGKFGEIYSVCLLNKHVVMYPETSEKIKACVETVKVDRVKMKKSLSE